MKRRNYESACDYNDDREQNISIFKTVITI